MEHRHPSFSNKLILMLGKALVHLLNDSGAALHDLIFACGLPDHVYGVKFQKGYKCDPEDYVRKLAKHAGRYPGDSSDVVKLIEAIHKEATTPNPAVLTKSSTSTIPGEQRIYMKPQSYIRLIRQLETEGFAFSGYSLVQIDSEASQEFQEKTELAARVRSHPELDPTTLIHHMDESESTLGNGNWGSAASEARKFLEGLVVNISKSAAQKRNQDIPDFPTPEQPRPEFTPCRKYLMKISLTTIEEDRMISSFWSFASVEGSHYGVTPQHMAKLTRRFCWVLAAHLLTKYESQSGTA